MTGLLRTLAIILLVAGLGVSLLATRAALGDDDYYRKAAALERHADNVLFEAEYNMALSQRRAESVRAYLVSRGVPDWRLVPRGYGETNPKYPNDSEGRNWRNRRVELRRIRS